MSELEKRIEELISQKERVQQISKIKNQNSLGKIEIVDKTVSNLSLSQNVMNKKADIISHLRHAKTAHVAWISNVQILIQLANIEDAKATTPINYTTCAFGKWYYGEGQMLTPFQEYRDIEAVHQYVHNTYLQIFGLYNKKLEGSFFKSIKKLEQERKEKAMQLEIVLKEYSKLMFDLLIALEMKIKRMSDSEIDSL